MNNSKNQSSNDLKLDNSTMNNSIECDLQLSQGGVSDENDLALQAIANGVETMINTTYDYSRYNNVNLVSYDQKKYRSLKSKKEGSDSTKQFLNDIDEDDDHLVSKFVIDDLRNLDPHQILQILNSVIDKRVADRELIVEAKRENSVKQLRIDKLIKKNETLGKDNTFNLNRLKTLSARQDLNEDEKDFSKTKMSTSKTHSDKVKNKVPEINIGSKEFTINNDSDVEQVTHCLAIFRRNFALGKISNMTNFTGEEINYLYHMHVLLETAKHPNDIHKTCFHIVSKPKLLEVYNKQNNKNILLSGDVEENPGPNRHVTDKDHQAYKHASSMRGNIVNHLIQNHRDETIPMLNKLYDSGKIAKDPSVGGIFNDIFHILSQFGGRTMTGVDAAFPGFRHGLESIAQGELFEGLDEIMDEAKRAAADPARAAGAGITHVVKSLLTNDDALTRNISTIFPHSDDYNKFFNLNDPSVVSKITARVEPNTPSSLNPNAKPFYPTAPNLDPNYKYPPGLNPKVEPFYPNNTNYLLKQFSPSNLYSHTSSSSLGKRGLVETNPGPITLAGNYDEVPDKWSASELWGIQTELQAGDKSDFTRSSDGVQLYKEVNAVPSQQTNGALIMKGIGAVGPSQGTNWILNPPERAYLPSLYLNPTGGTLESLATIITSSSFSPYRDTQAIIYRLTDMGGRGLIPTGLGEKLLSEQSFYNLATQTAQLGTQIDGLTRLDMVKLMTKLPVRGANLSSYLVKTLYLYNQYLEAGSGSLTSNIYDDLVSTQQIRDDIFPGGINNPPNLGGSPSTCGILAGPDGFTPTNSITSDPYDLYEGGIDTLAFFTSLSAIPGSRSSLPTVLFPFSMIEYLPIWVYLQCPMPLVHTFDYINVCNTGFVTNLNNLAMIRSISKTIITGYTNINVVLMGTGIASTLLTPVNLQGLTYGASQYAGILPFDPLLINTSTSITQTYGLLNYLSTWWLENEAFVSTTDWTNQIISFMTQFLFPRLGLSGDLDYAYTQNSIMSVLYNKLLPTGINTSTFSIAKKTDTTVYRPQSITALNTTDAPTLVNALNCIVQPLDRPPQCFLPIPDYWAANLLISGLATQSKTSLAKEFDIIRYPVNSLCIARSVAAVTNSFITGSCLTIGAWTNFINTTADIYQSNYYALCSSFSFDAFTRRWRMEKFYNTYFNKVTGWSVPTDDNGFSIVSGLTKPSTVLNTGNTGVATVLLECPGVFLTTIAMAAVARSLPFSYYPAGRLETLPLVDEIKSKARITSLGTTVVTCIPSDANFSDVKSTWQVTKSKSSVRSLRILGGFTLAGAVATDFPNQVGSITFQSTATPVIMTRCITKSNFFVPTVTNSYAPGLYPWIRLYDTRRKEAIMYMYTNVAQALYAQAITDSVKGNYTNNTFIEYVTYDNPTVPKLSIFEAQDSGIPNIARILSQITTAPTLESSNNTIEDVTANSLNGSSPVVLPTI